MTDAKIARSDLLTYGALAVPLAFAGLPLYIHAPDFYATEYGVSLTSLGTALLFLRLIDGVQDPVLGYLSDRFLAYRMRFMAVAAMVLVGGFVMLFHPLEAMPLLWFVLAMFLSTTAFSLLSINYNAIGAVWSDKAHEKSRITGTREGLGLVGLLIGVSLPSIAQQYTDTATSFTYASLGLVVLAIMSYGLFYRWQAHQPRSVKKGETAIHWRQLLQMPRNIRRFFLIYGVSLLASAIPAILVLFFIRDRLQAEAYTGLFLVIYFLAGTAGIPLWLALSKRIGKARSWMIAMGLAVVSFIWAFFLGAGDLVAFGVICLASGMTLGSELALPSAMLADHLQEEGEREAANSYYALLALLLKSAMALGSAITLPMLDWVGFAPGKENSEQALLALSAAYALIPCLIKLASMVLLWRYLPSQTQGDSHDEPILHAFSDRSPSDA